MGAKTTGTNFHIDKVDRSINPVTNTLNFLGNLVSPSSARIHSAHKCTFQMNIRGISKKGSVMLLMIKNKSFADYTTWEKIEIIDLGEVLYKSVQYYIVVKYLGLEVEGRLKYLHTLSKDHPDNPF